MNLVKSIEQYNDKNTFFCEPIKNNIMSDGNFIRILYSTQHFILNGIYLLVNFHDITCEKFYNKYKCIFNVLNHKDIIDNLKTIEEDILKKYNTNKFACYKIYEQMKSGYIKIFTDVGNRSHCSFILKISGIWETQYNCGLTYKFLKVN
jgi:hypothetical protein